MDSLSPQSPKRNSRREYYRQRRNQIVTKICAECNLPYQSHRGNDGKKPTYCDDCKAIRRKRFRPQTFLICRNCGQQFGPVDHLKVRYCSKECKHEGLRDKPNAKQGRKYPHTQRASTLTCPACGNQFRTTNNTKRYQQQYCSHDCYLKSRRVSHFEKRVMDLIQSFGIPLVRQVRLGRWLFDGAIPDTNILIEADGAFWHSPAKVKDRDERKNQWCKDQGYVLIRVPELEFYRNPIEAVDVIITRWEKHSGQTATLLERVEVEAHV